MMQGTVGIGFALEGTRDGVCCGAGTGENGAASGCSSRSTGISRHLCQGVCGCVFDVCGQHSAPPAQSAEAAAVGRSEKARASRGATARRPRCAIATCCCRSAVIARATQAPHAAPPAHATVREDCRRRPMATAVCGRRHRAASNAARRAGRPLALRPAAASPAAAGTASQPGPGVRREDSEQPAEPLRYRRSAPAVLLLLLLQAAALRADEAGLPQHLLQLLQSRVACLLLLLRLALDLYGRLPRAYHLREPGSFLHPLRRDANITRCHPSSQVRRTVP